MVDKRTREVVGLWARWGGFRMTAGLLLGAVAGCGASDTPPRVTVYEVTGSILLRDGKPLRGGRVAFVPQNGPLLLASATVGPDGAFSLTTGDSGEGAPPGDYKVRVEPEGPPPVVPPGARSVRGLPFPPRYLDEDSSGLRVTVQPGPNRLGPIVLK